MPFRRRPPEPSPRLRAIMEAAGRERAVAVHDRDEGDVGSASDAAGGTPERRLAAVPGPWTPPPGQDVPAGRHRRPRPPIPAFLTLPQTQRGARLDGPRAAAVGLLLVVVHAGACFGARIAWARAASQPHVVAPGRPGSAVEARASPTAASSPGGGVVAGSGFATTPTSSGGGGPPTASGGLVTVHVVGQVRRPGVLRLQAGARVTDAVAAAGGVRAAADPAAINLARVLVDGEQIRVPKVGEVPVVSPGGAAGAEQSAGGSGTAGAGSPGAGALPAQLVNLNTASLSELDSLPGVGPVLAQRILDWRAEHGRFASVDELGEVSGIGEKIFAQLRPKVSV